MAGERIAILAGRVLTGEDLTERMNGCVLVEDGRIRDVISKYEFEALRETWPAVDLGQATLLPGLFDCHSHLALDAGREGHLQMMELPEPAHWELARDNLQKDLFAGVTTMRCMGDRYYLDIRAKEMIQKGELCGPDLLVCGTGMRSANGHGYVGLPHTGAEAFKRTSRENIACGADHLKIFVSPGIPAASPEEAIPCFLSQEEISAVTKEAKKAGVQTTAHCIGGEGLDLCVRLGIDVLDHLYSVTPEQVKLLETSFGGWIDLTSGIVMDEGREAFTPPEQNIRMRKAREYSIGCMERLCQSKELHFTLGTDAYHGMLWKEIEFAVQLGIPRRQALLAVTVNASRMTGTGSVKGQIAPGFAADLIASPENVMTQENALADVRFVMKNGRVIKK